MSNSSPWYDFNICATCWILSVLLTLAPPNLKTFIVDKSVDWLMGGKNKETGGEKREVRKQEEES
jgi:hypothetical protein